MSGQVPKMIGRAQADSCSILDLKRCRGDGVQRSKQEQRYHLLKWSTLLPHLLLVKLFRCTGLEDLHQDPVKATEVFCDNKATIFITKNPVFQGRTKHIELRHHFI